MNANDAFWIAQALAVADWFATHEEVVRYVLGGYMIALALFERD